MLIDWFTVAAQAFNFLILVWLLKRFLYKPVLAAIDEREKRIATQLQDAEKKRAEALKEQTDFLHKNEEFERQRSGLLLEAANAAKTERERLLATARRDSEELRSKLQKSIYDELDDLNRKIGTLALQEVFSIARKTLADLADVSLERTHDEHVYPSSPRHERQANSRAKCVSSFLVESRGGAQRLRTCISAKNGN
jgi:F-type H+-transporting ATPase subunit b